MQEGNCFDFSILLTSLLRGVGYDAYVVSGYATKDIALMDESKVDVDSMEMMSAALGFYSEYKRDGKFWMVGEELEKENDKHSASSTTSINDDAASKKLSSSTIRKEDLAAALQTRKYKVKPARKMMSQFLIRQEQKRKELEFKLIKQKKEEIAKKKATCLEEEDELKGLRVHSWVLVLPGKREVAEAFFIGKDCARTIFPFTHPPHPSAPPPHPFLSLSLYLILYRTKHGKHLHYGQCKLSGCGKCV